MLQRVRAAVQARTDPDFVICARTDARAIEGLDAAIDRAKAYVDAGADMVFPEALRTESEFAAFREAVDVPLLANMTEFGTSPALTARRLENLGYNLVIWPVSSLRAAMGAVEDLFDTLDTEGTQASHVDRMQTRARLYELVDYASYAEFDRQLFDFKIPGRDA
jgi:methylisocitrate lyase